MEKLHEASGNIDKLYALFDKAIDQVQKAADAVLDVADTMDSILVESTAIGGKIEEIVPSNIQSLISKLTEIADTDLNSLVEGDQSSISALKDMVGSIPYRDLRPSTKEERINKISTMPNLENGPQSSAFQESTKNDAQRIRETTEPMSLNFDSLRESEDFASNDTKMEDLNGIIRGQASYQSPIEVMQTIQATDAVANDDSFEEDDNFDPEKGVPGVLDMNAINIPKVTNNLSFDAVGGLDMTNLNTSFDNL